MELTHASTNSRRWAIDIVFSADLRYQTMGSRKKAGSTKGLPKSKIHKVLDEWKSGKLHTGSKSGPVVTNKKQALAIAISEARKKKRGGY